GEMGFGSPLPQVGAVPILLRSVLGAAKAGATRIVVVIDRVKGSRIVQDLLKTRRLPRNVGWCEVTSGAGFLPSLLGELASEIDGHLVVIAGDRVYHPSLHKRASEWDTDGADALALMSGRELVGICSLSREASVDLAGRCPGIANSIEDVLAWLRLTRSVESEAVSEENWQRIINEDERVSAERKLGRLAGQAHRRDLRQTDPPNLHPDQPPDHSLPNHAQHGQPVHARRELRRGRLFRSRGILEHGDRRASFVGLERARRLRR